MSKQTAIITFVVLALFLVLGAVIIHLQSKHETLKAECEKREALIKAADESAAAIAASLAIERQARADLAADYEQLEKRLKNVRKPKKANDFSNLPDAARADSLRGSIIRAVQQ